MKVLEGHAADVGVDVLVEGMAREVSNGTLPEVLSKLYGGIPYICLKRFMEAHGEMFSLAKRAYADKLVGDALKSVDEEDVVRGRLKVDTYLKIAGKVSKDEWGDGQNIGGMCGNITIVIGDVVKDIDGTEA